MAVPRLIPPPNVATHTSCGLYGLMKTRSTHAKGKLATSLKFADENPATVTSGAYSTPRVPVATYISFVPALIVTELTSIDGNPSSEGKPIFVHVTPRLV